MATKEEVQALMAKHAGAGINCGTTEHAPSAERIRETEELLNVPLPDSYKWFLSQYGNVVVGGDEVWSIYPEYSATMYSGDIAYQYKNDAKGGLTKANEISIAATDFGEWFVFDTTQKAEGNEYPVLLMLGEERQPYAANFLEFIAKFIRLQCDG